MVKLDEGTGGRDYVEMQIADSLSDLGFKLDNKLMVD